MFKRFSATFLSLIMMIMVVCPPVSMAAELKVDTINSMSVSTQDTDTAEEKEAFSDSTVPFIEVDVGDSNSDDSTDDTGISPLAYTQPDLTEFDLVSIKTGDGRLLQRFNLSDQVRVMSTSHTAKYAYDSSEPIVLTFYQKGYGYSVVPKSPSFKTKEGTIYNYTLDSHGGAIAWYWDLTLTDIDPALSELTLTVEGRQKKSPYFHFYRKITIKFDDKREDGPSNPHFSLNPNNSDQYLLVGVDSTMEYRTKDSSYPLYWTPCTDEPISFNIPSSDISYLVRYKATENKSESKYTEITLPKRPSAPSTSVNWVDETFSNISTTMECAIGDGTYSPVTTSMIDSGAAPFIDQATNNDPVVMNFRYPATTTTPASMVRTIKIYPRQSGINKLELNPNTYIVTGVNSSMQYMVPGGTSWISISGTSLNLSAYAKSDQEVPIMIRMKSTSTTSPSKPYTVLLPKLASAPTTLSLDFAAEKVIGFQSNLTYQYRINNSNWSNISLSNLTFAITNQIASTDRTLGIRVVGTDSTQLSGEWQVTLPARPAAPATPTFIYNDPSHPGQAILTGMSVGEEYRGKNETTWTKVTSDKGIVFDLPSAGTTYYIHTAATDHSFASANKSLTLYANGTAPSCSYNTTTELITSLTTSMEMKVGEGKYQPVTETTFSTVELINNLTANKSLTICVRYAATETRPASNYRYFTLYPRIAPPANLVYNYSTNAITGCNSSMQYRLETSTGWTSISGSTLNLQSYVKTDTDVKVYIRMKPTNTTAASLPVEFTIPQMLAGPTGTIDYLNESIVGLANGNYQYSTNASSWTNLTVANGGWDISTLLSTSARTLYLRKAATNTDPITAYTAFKVAARPVAPSTPVFVYNDSAYPEKAVLGGLDTTMQYRKSTDTEWTDIANKSGIVFDIPTTSVTYYIRSKSTSESFASANRSITLLSRSSVPNCSYNSTTEKIVSLSTSMEMQINNGAYMPITEATFVTTDMIEGLSTGQNVVINVRYMATATKPASNIKSFTLYSRTAKPSSLVYNYGANSVSGCANTMEYRLETATSWTTISGSTLNLQSYVKTDTDLKVYIRTKATSTSAASLPVEFTIPKMLDGPTGEIYYLGESITGLANGNYQYSTNGSSWTNITVTNGSWDISNLLSTSSRTLYLRKAATDTTPLTNRTAFTIPARPVYPSSPSFVYNDSRYPDKAVMSDVTPDMEYKKSTDTTWTPVRGDDGVVFDIPSASTTYYVRYKSTEQAFSSTNKSITLSKAGTAPRCSYNNKTEIITSLTTKMEMKIGNGDYVPVNETTFSVTNLIDSVPSGSTSAVYIRYMATATAPASKDWVLTINPRVSAQTVGDNTNSFEGSTEELGDIEELSLAPDEMESGIV